MRVKINPGTYDETEKELCEVMLVEDYYVDFNNIRELTRYSQNVAKQNAKLISLLVEKDILTLADCRELGAPSMEKV